MTEEWRPSTNPKYEVSDQGRVRNKTTGRIRKPAPDRDGYLRVSTYSVTPEGVRKWGSERVHRLVCEAFHGPAPEGKTWVLHRNGVPWDNRASNVYWGDAVDNTRDAFRHGTARMSNRTSCDRGHTYEPGSYYYSEKLNKRVCKACRKARKVPPPEADPRHGKKSTYDNYGCRCAECGKAKREWDRNYRARKL